MEHECEVVVVITPEVPRSPLVGVVMGSKSDWETMRHAAEVLTELGVPVEARSSRRTGRPSACSATAATPKAGAWS